MRRLDYKLYAAFMHATMIDPSNKSVEFEVSIGEFAMQCMYVQLNRCALDIQYVW